MQKKIIYLVPFTAVAALLFIIYQVQARQAPLRKGGFSRIRAGSMPVLVSKQAIADSLHTILYANDEKLLARANKSVVEYRFDTKKQEWIQEKVIVFSSMNLRQVQIHFKEQRFVIFNPLDNELAIFTQDGLLLQTSKLPYLVSKMAVWDENNIIIRKLNTENEEHSISIIDRTGMQRTITDSTTFPSKNDMGMRFDGQFTSNGQFAIYTCFFSNHMAAFDKNGRIVWKSNTIDTCSQPPVVITNAAKTEFRYGSNLQMVNQNIQALSNKLFVQSAIPAENDMRQDWSHHIIMDVYDCNNGKYLHSLYLEREKNDYIKNVYITEKGKVIALSKSKLYLYQ
jgi:hypothetical protein